MDVAKETIQNIINEIKNCTDPKLYPTVKSVMYEDKQILCIYQEQFPFRPVSFKDRFYVRKDASNHSMTKSEISDMYLASHSLSRDAYVSDEQDLIDTDLVDDLALQI